VNLLNKKTLRDNLLVTIGSRAAYMDAAGCIALAGNSAGEDELARFASALADQYLESDFDVCFDELIETALMERFAVKR